jgi:hypothetical protein
MSSNSKWKVIVIGAIVALLVLIAVVFRYDVTVRDDGVYTLDRWTGKIEGCDGVVCVDLNGDLPPTSTPPLPPPDIRVKLFDGTELIFAAGTSRQRMDEVARQVTSCKQRRRRDLMASRECAVPTVEEQLNGLGWESVGS